MGAALGGGEGVDLVDDHRLDVDERVGGVRRQHQVEALGRRDQQVRRAAQHRLTLLGRRVAGAHPDVGKVQTAEPCRPTRRRAARRPGRCPTSGARRFFSTSKARARSGEMYSDARARLAVLRGRRRDEPVDRPQEGGERLAAPGRRADQRVLAGGDGRPARAPGASSARGRTRRTTPAPPARTPPAPDDQRWFRG